jgi:hypothetical protein
VTYGSGMRMGLRFAFFGSALAMVTVSALSACGSSGTSSSFTNPSGSSSGGTSSSGSGSGDGNGAGNGADSGSSSFGSGNAPPTADAGPPADAGTIAVVYAHSDDTLYQLDPTTNAITVIGTFSGCSDVIDIAVDESSDAYVTTESGFYKLDLTSAACTHIADGSYPNSLSFVPKGTLDPNVEALVGYNGATYVRIDTTSGAVTNVGSLSGGYSSSGDIVSVIGGGTFLTVNGNGCSDCLLQVDPATGNLIQNYGSVSHSNVFGLAFWGGTAYGFDDQGDVFSIDVSNGQIVTTAIPVPNAPSGLSFWGAGSTTSAPPTAADGGGIPIQPPK